MLVVWRFDVTGEDPFVGAARAAIEALAQCRGYVRGQLGRSYDQADQWCLVTEWETVGSYRRAMSSYEVKVRATPLLAQATPDASAFEVLASAGPGQRVSVTGSDLADERPRIPEIG